MPNSEVPNTPAIDEEGYKIEVHFARLESNKELLSHAAMNYLGLPEIIHDKAQGMNDDGKSFSEIADWLETVL